MNQRPSSWYGPIAMQKRRLSQVEALIEQYTKLIQDSGDHEQFGVALERAIQQKLRIQNWLAIHEKSHPRAEPEKTRTAMATLIY